jgi:hypothetical protein
VPECAPLRPIKTAALCAAALAAGKIATVEYLGHAATRDAMVVAYSAQAIEACQRVRPIEGLQATATPWTRPHDMRLIVGDRRHPVGLWQVDHAAWADRYRKTYLLILAGLPAAPERCTFDIAAGTATVAPRL